MGRTTACHSPSVCSAISVRPASEADLEFIGQITVGAYHRAGQLDDGPERGYGLVLADSAARYQDAILLVATRNEEIVGTVTICPPGSRFGEIGREGEVEFRFLAVAPHAWGSGVANVLIEACETHARQVAADRLVICVRDTNVGAMEMYRRRGFTRMPERDFRPVPGVALLAMERTCMHERREWAQPDSNR